MKILMLHGINHNMFGKRDPKQYGTTTLAGIDEQLQALSEELGAEIESFQTNSESAMCERIHQGFTDGVDAVLINAGAWTHYSYGIRDALAILTVPVVELHMSNIQMRHSAKAPCQSQQIGSALTNGLTSVHRGQHSRLNSVESSLMVPLMRPWARRAESIRSPRRPIPARA
jgi:3-dehydroquinate dehydratase-2